MAWNPPPPDVEVFHALIPPENLPVLLERLEKVQKRARRIGSAPIGWEVGSPVPKPLTAAQQGMIGLMVRDPMTGEERRVERVAQTYRYPIAVWGEEPRIPGFRLRGVVTPAHGDLNLLTAAPRTPEGLLEPFRRGRLSCDHCGTVRKRAETFVLEEEASGQLHQVGRQCLKDFTGHGDPRGIMELWALEGLLAEASEEGHGMGGGGVRRGPPDLVKYLSAVALSISQEGWVSRGKAREGYGQATADHAWYLLSKADPQGGDSASVREKLRAQEPVASEALAEARERLGRAAASDYERNLQVVLESGVVGKRSDGLAASVFAYLNRARAEEAEARRQAERVAKGGGYFGVVSERGTWLMDLVRIFHYEGFYGPGTGHVFLDDQGNQGLWFQSGYSEPDLGRYYVTGTVKKHETDRDGIPTTFLSRVSLENLEEGRQRLLKRHKVGELRQQAVSAGLLDAAAAKKTKKARLVELLAAAPLSLEEALGATQTRRNPRPPFPYAACPVPWQRNPEAWW